jgi:hypothetical protein
MAAVFYAITCRPLARPFDTSFAMLRATQDAASGLISSLDGGSVPGGSPGDE